MQPTSLACPGHSASYRAEQNDPASEAPRPFFPVGEQPAIRSDGRQGRIYLSTSRSSAGMALLDKAMVLGLILRRIVRTVRGQWALVAVASLAAAYIAAFSYLSIVKYNSFHATVGDLGLHNQIYWLLLNGGPAAYGAHGFDQWYPFPFAKLSMFTVLPIYALYPHPETLLVVQSAALGIAVLPLYFLSLHYIPDRRFGIVIVLVYLMYYPMQGANLFDFHPESLFPLFFISAVYYWHKGSRIRFSLFLIFAALLGPGALIACALFLAYAVWKGSEFHFRRLTFNEIVYSLRQRRLESALFLMLLVAFALEYLAGSITPYVVRANPLTPWNIPVNINVKLQYFILLLAPIGFIALWDRLSLLLLTPFVVNVLFSTSSALTNPFVLHYPLMILPILFLGTIRGTKVLCDSGTSIRQGRLRQSAVILLTLTIAFAVVYSPVGPLNSYVQGGYFAGNHDLGGITLITEHDEFVRSLIELIPADASVLTENDIPQVSGRPGFYVVLPGTPPPPPPSSGQYDYILADASVQYFAQFDVILPYINAALANNSFGILAMGQGAILLKRGHIGEPLILEPFKEFWTPDQLSLFSGTRTAGRLVHQAADGGSFAFWFGPYVALPPGHYLANFSLQVESVTPTDARIITLQVMSDSGNNLWASQVLTLGQFSSAMAWQNFTLEFTLSQYTTGIELRGMSVTTASTIALSGVSLLQTSV